MSNRNRFLVGSVALALWVSGFIVPDFFLSAVQTAKPSSGSSARTLVEIISRSVAVAYVAVYTVPAGHHLVLTDVIFSGTCGNTGNIYRDGAGGSLPQEHCKTG